MVVVLRVPSGQESNGAKRAGTESVGGIKIIEQLDVGAEFKGVPGKIRVWSACNK